MNTTFRTLGLGAPLLAAFLGACSGSTDYTTNPPPATTGTVQGQVMDGANGVAGAGLALSMAGQATRSTTTGADGGFSFLQVPVGTWSLSLTAPTGYSVSGSGTSAVSVTDGGTATQNFALTSGGGGNSVSVQDFSFAPASLTVSVGTTVTFTNNGAVTHTVTADAGGFDSGNLAAGSAFQFTFNSPGTFAYHCAIHPSMTATIKVQ